MPEDAGQQTKSLASGFLPYSPVGSFYFSWGLTMPKPKSLPFVASLVLIGGIVGLAPLAAQESKATDATKTESTTAPTPTKKPAPTARMAEIERAPRQLPTKGSMLVHVVDPDGRPIPGAKLHANISSWDADAAWDKHWVIKNDDYVSGADGAVEIKLPELVEDLRLWAQNDGYVPLFAIWWPKYDSGLAAIPDEFTYRMQPGTLIGGIVKNEDGAPVEGAKIEVAYNPKDVRAMQEQFTARGVFSLWLSEGDTAVVTDAEGRWILNRVPPGDNVQLSLKLSHPDYVSDEDWGGLQGDQQVTVCALRAQTAVIVLRRPSASRGK